MASLSEGSQGKAKTASRLGWAGMVLGLAVLVPVAARPAWHPDGADFTLAGATLGLSLTLTALVTALWHRVLSGGRLGLAVRRGNLAAGVVAAGHAFGTCLVASHCFAADDLPSLWIGVTFFAVAEVSLVGLSLLFRGLTYYADDQEILGENLAAAVSYTGVVVALSMIVGHAADGHFSGWLVALRSFGLCLPLALLLYPFRQIVIARLLLGYPLTFRGGVLDRAVAQDRNVAVSLIEALGYLAAAFLATGLS